MARQQYKRVGVTVMPEYFQSEGIEAVLTNVVDRLGATSVTTSPYVAAPAPPALGFREPPPDAGAGSKRLLERPLWGRQEVHMVAAPSFVPDRALYAGGQYAPEVPTELTESDGPLVRTFLRRAGDRGLKTYLQVMAAMPPALRVQVGRPADGDEPLLPDGSPVPSRVDRNTTLASHGVRSYMRALIGDLCQNYPECDGFRFDWPEYPPYHFMSLFADYNPQVAPYAEEIGLELSQLAQGFTDALNLLKTKGDLDQYREVSVTEACHDLRRRFPAIDDHCRLREHLVRRFAAFLRECVDDASRGSKAVLLQGFPPPWNTLSGFEPKALRRHADELAIKFYTMHWPMIGANYVESVVREFDVSEESAADYFRLRFMGQASGGHSSAPLAYPEPGHPHGISAERMRSAYQEFGDSAAIAILHSYGPCDDVVERCEAIMVASNNNIEINRYAYLGEEKLDAMSALFNRVIGDAVSG